MATKKLKKTQTDTQTENLAETENNKRKLVIQLEKCPIIQVACQQSDIGRATYYKWRKEDVEFMRAADNAIRRGVSFVNDLAESQIIKGVQNDMERYVIFWLKHRHPAYSEKMQHRHFHEVINREIDPEQIALIKKSMGNFASKIHKDSKGGRSWQPKPKEKNT